MKLRQTGQMLVLSRDLIQSKTPTLCFMSQKYHAVSSFSSESMESWCIAAVFLPCLELIWGKKMPGCAMVMSMQAIAIILKRGQR